jgi:hypothetical protein
MDPRGVKVRGNYQIYYLSKWIVKSQLIREKTGEINWAMVNFSDSEEISNDWGIFRWR